MAGGIDLSSYVDKPQGGIDLSQYVDQPQQAPRGWLDSVKDFAQAAWQQVNPVSGLQGANQLVTHPIQSLQADAAMRKEVEGEAEQAFKKGNYAEGVAHALYSVIPFLGPQMNQAGNQLIQGQYAKGLGSSVGMGLGLAGPEAVKAAIPNVDLGGYASKLYQSALKPPPGSYSLPEVQKIVQTGLKEGIPVSQVGIEKIGSAVNDLQSGIRSVIAQNPNAPISTADVASRLTGVEKKFGTQVNPLADLEAIQKSGQEFQATQPANIPAEQAQALKQGTYRTLGERAYGELGSATVEAQKALARGLKEEIAKQFPEISGMNAREGALLDLQGALERAIRRQGNHQLLGIGTPLAASGMKAITGSTGAAGVSAVVKAIVDDPIIKSKLAIAMNKGGGIPFNDALARLAAYSNQLGNAAAGSSQPPGGQTNAP
jgi:hypothetical protein